MSEYYKTLQTSAGTEIRKIARLTPAPPAPDEGFDIGDTIEKIKKQASDAVDLANTVTQTDTYKEGLKTANKLRERATELKKQADEFVAKNLPKEATQARQDAAAAEDIADNLVEQSGGAGAFNETVSLSDYRKKLLEERLEKLTIGLIK